MAPATQALRSRPAATSAWSRTCACGGGCPRCDGAGETAENPLADVRVFLDSQRALDLGALAFTQGRQIHVAPGQWAPHTASGHDLLAHELGHVVQQQRGAIAPTRHVGTTPINEDAPLEREADTLGQHALRGLDGFGGFAISHADGAGAMHGTVQRRSSPEPEACPAPATLACSVGADDPPRISQLFLFSRNSATLDPAQIGILDGVAATWNATGGGTVLRIDGYASAEGDCNFNWTLSCRRASAVSTALQSPSTGAAGVPAAQIQALAKGESDTAGDALADNRRATLLVPPPPLPTTQTADQRVSGRGRVAAEPDATLATEIGYELDPSSRPTPAPPPPPPPRGGPPPPPPPPPARIPWDGATGSPTEAASRTAMQNELFNAFDAYLTFKRPTTQAQLARPTVPFNTPPAPVAAVNPPTGVVDIAEQARSVLETRYATSMDAAASTPAQVAQRGPLQTSGAGQNLFDASSEADRSLVTGDADLGPDVAWWLFENDVPGAAGAPGSRRFASEILVAHHYSTQDAGAEDFRWSVAHAYSAANTLAPSNQQQLIDYRMADWSESSQEGGQPGFTLQSRFDPGATPARSELVQRWQIFQTATHEILHLRTHPAFEAADRGRGTMKEGFVEMFTISTLNGDVFPDVRAGSREPLRHAVEGSGSPAAPDATLITNRTTPTQYVEHRAQAERIRDGGTPPGGGRHAGVGEQAVRAAFFQGHVEYLGLDPTGAQQAGLPAAGAAQQLRIPAGIADLNELARRSGVARATIERDNPGIAVPLPATAVLAGCRQHRVVGGETRVLIAAQNGVSEAALAEANPDVPLDPATNNWPVLAAGRVLLIPVH